MLWKTNSVNDYDVMYEYRLNSDYPRYTDTLYRALIKNDSEFNNLLFYEKTFFVHNSI